MLSVVNALDSEGLNLKEVKFSSGACSPDSVKIISMLKYLTSQGRIVQENGTYYIKLASTMRASKPRRTKLIQELVALLDELSIHHNQ